MNKNKIISELLNLSVKSEQFYDWVGRANGYLIRAPQIKGIIYCEDKKKVADIIMKKKIELLDMAIEAAK